MEGSTRPSSSGHSFSGSAALTDATADATGDIKAFRRVDGAGGLLIKDGGLQDTLFRLLYTTSAVRYSASWKARSWRKERVVAARDDLNKHLTHPSTSRMRAVCDRGACLPLPGPAGAPAGPTGTSAWAKA